MPAAATGINGPSSSAGTGSGPCAICMQVECAAGSGRGVRSAQQGRRPVLRSMSEAHFRDKQPGVGDVCRRVSRQVIASEFAMGAFLVGASLATIPVLVIVAVIVFTLIRLVPGDPAAVIAGNMATNEGHRAHPH